jgi:hypothetical protein
MTDVQAGIVAQAVAQYLGAWGDRHAPFHAAEGVAHSVAAHRAFNDHLLHALANAAELNGTQADDRTMVAFLCLLCPGAPGVVPPQPLRDQLLSHLRCAFPRRFYRMQMIRSFVIAFGCGNWRPGPAPWPEAQAAIVKMARAAVHAARQWILAHVFGAAAYASHPAVLALGTPLEIQNVAQFAEMLTQQQRVPVQIGPAGLHLTWAGGVLSIPALGTLKPGAKRVFTCPGNVHIQTPNGPLDAPAGSRLVFTSRERRFDIEAFLPDESYRSKKIEHGHATVHGPTLLELWPCHCGSESCIHRHTLRSWSPRIFVRLVFPPRAPQTPAVASFHWKDGKLEVTGPSYAHRPLKPRAIPPGAEILLGFSGVVNHLPVLSVPGHTAVLRRHARLRLRDNGGSLQIIGGQAALAIPPGGEFEIRFGADANQPSIAIWRAGCANHFEDQWIVPPVTDNPAPVGLAAFVASAINGGNYPIQRNSFSKGMYFAIACDFGFDVEGRLQFVPIVQNLCPQHGKFEGPICTANDRPFDPQTMRSVKSDRVILADTFLDGLPPPYSIDEFLRCPQCGNYYQIVPASFHGRPFPWCVHVIARHPLASRLAAAGAAGNDLATARIMEQMRAEANACMKCPPGHPRFLPIPWCPLHPLVPHAANEPALPDSVTLLWVRR